MASYLFLKSVQADKDANSSANKANITREITMEKHFSNTQITKPKHDEDILRRRKERFGEASPTRPKFQTGASTQLAHILAPKANVNILKKRKERFGESVSSLLKEIEEKEKLMKRQARFSNKSPIPAQAKQVKLKTFESSPNFLSGIEAFQTIDQIEEKERRKREWKH